MPRRLPRLMLRPEPLEDRVTPTGGLDPTFDVDGLLTLDVGKYYERPAVTVQADGRILVETRVGGWLAADLANYNPGHREILRFNRDGSLDAAFGAGGRIVLEPTTGNPFLYVAFDGRIYATASPADDFGVYRFNPDGSTDTTFGNGGFVTVDTASQEGAEPTHPNRNIDMATGVIVQPDGKVVVVGRTGGPYSTGVAAVRLNPDGSLDTTFDDDGRATFPYGEFRYDVDRTDQGGAVVLHDPGQEDPSVLYIDGKLIIAIWPLENTVKAYPAGGPYEPFYLGKAHILRLNPDGSLDPSFDADGVWTSGENGAPDIGTNEIDMVLQPDGRLVLLGRSTDINSGTLYAVRLNSDGSADHVFGTNGSVGLAEKADPGGIALLPDGRIVASYMDWSGRQSARLAVLNPDGRPDDFFAEGAGQTTIGFPYTFHYIADATDVVVTPDGRIVVVGEFTDYTGNFSSPTNYLAVAVYANLPDVPPPIPPETPPPGPPSPPSGAPAVLNDVSGDHVADRITASAPGAPPEVVVTDGRTGTKIRFAPFEASFTGGVFVTTADLDGDGWAELIVTPRDGGGPRVRVFSVAADGTIQSRADFFGLDDPAFRGGVNATATDVTGDGVMDLVVAAGAGGGPRVAIWDGQQLFADSPVCVADFFAFEASLRSGVSIAAGDLNLDGRADLAFGGGPGGGPRVRVIDGAKLLANGSFASLDEIAETTQLANFFADDAGERSGVRLTTRDMDNDGEADLLTGIGEGDSTRVCVYLTPNLLANADPVADQELDSFEAVLADGVFVG